MDELTLARDSESCVFCQKKKNEINYGPLYSFKNITAHYYCVLLSNNLMQNGADNQGILGFLLSDIRRLLKKSIHYTCTYCKKGNATLQCSKTNCKIMYHLPCGLKNGSMAQFFDSFKNFCKRHRPVQNIPKKYSSFGKNKICSICYETINFNDVNKILWAPCCKKTWYHRICIQQLALSAGYLFKCAICNDKTKFIKWMLQYGIFIPQKDASWELVPNAFEELLIRHEKCDAEECKCPEGRKQNKESTMWKIVLCQSCGSQGIHIACGKLNFCNPVWECCLCKKVVSKLQGQSTESKYTNLENLILKKKSKEEFLKSAASSSKILKPSSQFKDSGKKRKLSEDAENFILGKRKKGDADNSKDSFEIVDVESLDTFQVEDLLEVPLLELPDSHSPAVANDSISHEKTSIENPEIAADRNGEIELEKSRENCIEVIDISSDSETVTLDSSSSSSDEEVTIIGEYQRPRKKVNRTFARNSKSLQNPGNNVFSRKIREKNLRSIEKENRLQIF